MNMKNKLMMFNLIMISLVIFIITAAGNYFYQKAMMKSRLLYTTELQKQLSNSFSLKINSVEKSLELLGKSSEVSDFLIYEKTKDFSAQVVREQAVRDLFYDYEKIYPEYLNMVLISEDGKDYISNDSYRITDDTFANEVWFKEAMQDGYSYQFYNATRNLKSWKIYDNDTFLSIAKAVTFKNKKIGVLLIDLSLRELRDFYREFELDTDNFFFLMNANGQIILSPVNRIVHRIKSEWFIDDEGMVKAELLDRKYNLIYNKYENKKLIIVSAYDMLKEQEAMKPFLKISLSIAVVAFVLAITWAIYFVSKITKPLIKLSSLMKDASTGNLEVRFEENCDTEIQALGLAFNKMVIKIKELLEIVYKEQKQKREAELQVMQEQIKPHFLYNTLDMIAWMARKHKAFNIVYVIELMSNFFRISLSKGKEMIFLADELKMVSSYLDIQRLRYEGLFIYEINCPKKLEISMVPRLCLQPLVENCIYHGIKESDNEESILSITVEEIEKGIKILVEDNGKGMSEETMKELNRNLSENDWETWEGGFGVQNVGKRLWHSFEKGSGLSFYENEKGYTVAKLTILYGEKEGNKRNGNCESIDCR